MVLDVIISAILVVQSALFLPLNTLLFRIDTKASVFESGDDMYTVMWSTTLPGTGYITYEYNGEERTLYDEENAAIRTKDTIHSVRVPKKELDNNTYTCHSQQIGTKRAYVAVKGITVSSEPVEFRGYSGQDEIHALLISDIHENPAPAEKAVRCFEEAPDLIVMNGDAVSLMTSAFKFKQVLSYAYRFSGGSIPVIYTRGNHENRGEYGAEVVELFKTTTGGLYYTCSYGPAQFLCLDSGEDKPDDDWTYSGLVDSTSYIARETEWMKVLALEEAEYTVCFAHMPYLNNRYGFDWVEPLTDLGIDLFVGAHKHRINYEYNKDKAPFYQMIDGGKSGDDGYMATMLTFRDGEIYGKCFDDKGTMRGEHTYQLSNAETLPLQCE